MDLGLHIPGAFLDEQEDDSKDNESVVIRRQPCETREEKVTQLILDIFPDTKSHDVVLHTLDDSYSSLEIAVTLMEPMPATLWSSVKQGILRYPPEERITFKHFVLHIPNYDADEMDYRGITAEYIRLHSPDRAPKLLVFDKSDISALNCPYMLFERLPGQSLGVLWPLLNHEQKKCLAQDISLFLLKLHKIQSKTPGIISISNSKYDLVEEVKIERIRVPQVFASFLPGAKDTCFAPQQSTSDFLYEQIVRQQVFEEVEGLTYHGEIWNGFQDMIAKLSKQNLILDEDQFHFYYGDLQLRTFLVQVIDQATARVTGIQDWHQAMFAPKFMTTRAPSFLWTENPSVNDNMAAAVVPVDPEKLEYKNIFEETVGPEFIKGSLTIEYILARRMFDILLKGIGSEECAAAAMEIITEWNKLDV